MANTRQRKHYLAERRLKQAEYARKNNLDEKEFGKIYSHDVFEDIISNPDYAEGLINDFLFIKDSFNFIKSFFYSEKTHEFVNRFAEDKTSRPKEARFFRDESENYASSEVSKLIATALINHKQVRDYVENELSEEEWQLLKSYMKSSDLYQIEIRYPMFEKNIDQKFIHQKLKK